MGVHFGVFLAFSSSLSLAAPHLEVGQLHSIKLLVWPLRCVRLAIVTMTYALLCAKDQWKDVPGAIKL